MKNERRQRLKDVLEPLIELDEFSAAEAKQRCSGSAPAYVTRTLGALVRDGVLLRFSYQDQDRFRWQNSADKIQAVRWIDRQIHGTQVKETPEQERPRERLLRLGAGSLTTAELMAILIRVGVPKESAVDGAQKISNRFADRLDELARCSPAEMKQISPAATQASYTQIMAGIELGRRVANVESGQQQKRHKITSTRDAIHYCKHRFSDLARDGVQEEFHTVTLDTKHKPIHTHRVTVGTLDASLVHPREVFRPAIRDAASAVILVHNHPSGDPTPSREDHQVTQRLTEAGQLLGITVLDHIIVAKEHCVSIREQD
ncbi:MAG: DNA repair protein RadC [Pirellulales bacterium]|nr:DNA repair protein RadC [Pirellulales bacterium]